jgi:hypothetical protein
MFYARYCNVTLKSICPKLLFIMTIFRYFHSMAKHIDETGMDDLNNEFENAMFSSDAPINKLGHSIAGGITNYGIEVCMKRLILHNR